MPELFKQERVLRGRIECFLLERACSNPVKAQRSVLLRLIQRNAATRFGRAHGFSNIRTEADFRRGVPVRDYEDFRPFINRIIAGEQNVLTAQAPFMLAMTSGTTSEPKYIPVTRALQSQTARLMSAWLYRAERNHRGLLDHASVGIVSRAVEGHTPNGIPYGSASGLIYKNIPAFIRRSYAVPYLVSELHDYDERYFAAARFAVARRVSFIATPNPQTLLRLAEVVAENQERLVRAIRDGVLGIACTGQRETCDELTRLLRPDPARALELEQVIKRDRFLRPVDCWPDLKLIGCWTGGSAGLKINRLADFYGPVPLRDLGLMASEGRITVPFEDGTTAGLPSLHTSYYEFIPEEEEDSVNPSVLSLDELEDGRRYSILLTTAGGLYRYRINDIVEAAGFHGRTPLLRFVRKAGEMVSITGEKMHVNHLLEAMETVARIFNLRVEQFRAAPDNITSRYEIYLELERAVPHDWLRDEVLPAIDAALARVNLEYEQKRRSRRLNAPRMHLMASGWAGREMRKHLQRGRRDTQYKWQTLSDERRAEDALEITATIEAAEPAASSASAFAA
jgi:hypothetical protein